MIDVTSTEEIAVDARARANVLRLAAAQALTGANSAVIFATGSIVGATLAPNISFATVPLSMYVLGLAAGGVTAGAARACGAVVRLVRKTAGEIARRGRVSRAQYLELLPSADSSAAVEVFFCRLDYGVRVTKR